MFEKRTKSEVQTEMWVQAERMPATVPSAFYRRVNETLERMDFARQVWTICAPVYADASRGGRPGIDPVVYLKMLMVGFFENLPSDRAIAARCEDSLSSRGCASALRPRPAGCAARRLSRSARLSATGWRNRHRNTAA